jgi:MFS family permease
MLNFMRDNGRWLSGGFLLMLFSSFGQTFFIGMSGNDLRAAFDLSGGAFGGIYMLATLASAMTLPWLGRTLDVMPGWKVARFTIPALAFACVLIAVAPNVAVLTLSLYLLRLFGQGMMTETAFTETGRWFVANRGRAMAVIVQGSQTGTALLPMIVVLVHGWSGDWRGVWFASAAVLMLVGLPAIVGLMRVERVPQSTEAKSLTARTARDWTRGEVIRDPMLYLLLAGVLAPSFIATVIFFHQGYLIETRHYDPLAFAAAFTVMSLVTVGFSFVSGALIDRFGSLNLLPSWHLQRPDLDAVRRPVAGGLRACQSGRHPRHHGFGHGAVVGARPRHHGRPHRPGNSAADPDAVDGGLVRAGLGRSGHGGEEDRTARSRRPHAGAPGQLIEQADRRSLRFAAISAICRP